MGGGGMGVGGRQRATLGIFLNCFSSYFLRWGLSRTLELPGLATLVEAQGFSLSSLLSLGLQAVTVKRQPL